MPAGQRRISVGFQGGQVLALRVPDDELERLFGALDGSGWHELASEEGPVHLLMGKVVYVRVEDEDARVGFGA